MSNVLPGDVQKNNWRLHRARFIIASSLALILLAVVAILALAPSYLTLYSGAAQSSVQGPAADTSRLQLIASQSLVSLIAPILGATTSPSQAIAAAIADRPKGVFVQHVSYTKGAPGQLVIVGSGSGRATTNAYRQALSQDPRFISVTVPVADLLGTEGAKFSITLTGNF